MSLAVVAACAFAAVASGSASTDEPIVLEVAEIVNASDSGDAVGPAEVPVADNVMVEDTADVAPPISLTVSEAVGVSDATSAVPPVTVDTTEGVAVGDVASVIPPASATVSEGVGVGDAVVVTPSPVITTGEAVTVGDAVAVTPSPVVSTSESLSVSDSVDVEIISSPTKTSLVTSENPVLAGSSVTLTATVLSFGTPVVDGTVTFKDGTSTLAAEVPVAVAGTATFTTSTLALGVRGITATFNGATGYRPSASASLDQGVYDYALEVTPRQVTVQRGGTAEYVVAATLAPNSAFLNLPPTLPLTVSGAPIGSTSAIAHALASPTVGMPSMTELTIATDATTQVGDFPVTVTGPGPRSATARLYVNAAPVVDTGGPYTVDEGSSVTLAGSATDEDLDALSFAWDLDDDGSFEAIGAAPIFAADDGPRTQDVALQVCDDHEACTVEATTIVIRNIAPTTTLAAPTTVEEGSSFSVSLEDPVDPAAADAAGLHYAIHCDGSPLPTAYADAGASPTRVCSYDDGPSDEIIRARIYDKDGGSTEYTATVHVRNVPPVIAKIDAPEVIEVNVPLDVTAHFTDEGVRDTHTGTFAWADGTTSAGLITESSGAGTMTGSHSFTAPGIYPVRATVLDKDGGAAQREVNVIVFKIDRRDSADFPGTVHTALGTATVGAGVNFKNGVAHCTLNVVIGRSFLFAGKACDWATIFGARSLAQGSGTLNGIGAYAFSAYLLDGQAAGGGGQDRLRIKIWEKATGNVILDTQPGTDKTDAPTTIPASGNIEVVDN
jgi:hypothetical protein